MSSSVLLQLFWILSVIATAACSTTGKRLNGYVIRYDVLDYDRDLVAQQHERSRRSAGESGHVQVSFYSHQRTFRLRLKQDVSVFHQNLKIVDHDGQLIDVDMSHLYEGHLLDEPGSVVFGSVRDGIFDGNIHSINGTYYVERASKYFPEAGNFTNFHSVIYKDEHVVDPYEKQHTRKGGCGVSDDVASRMDSVQHAAVSPDEEPDDLTASRSSNFIKETVYKYYKEANAGVEKSSRRQKRSLPRWDNRSTCPLFIQTDPMLWKHVYEMEKRNAEATRQHITSMIAQHVKAVNLIYTNTKFDGKYQHRMYHFEVQRIKIDEHKACELSYSGKKNKFCLPNIGASKFLDLFSEADHSDVCLAYVFTYRDFTDGTLGIAWEASPSEASGGICAKYKTYTENVGGVSPTPRQSRNTGMITFANCSSQVPPKVSQLTLAHEIGHNFGSPHDSTKQCRPGGKAGNFVMFARAPSVEGPNNFKFSKCSVAEISKVLDSVQDGKKRNCFTEWKGALCGNKIVEEDEECDCGFDDKECKEKCCYPRIVSDKDKLGDPSAQGCKRRPNTQCSPSQGQCCTKQCMFVPPSARRKCKKNAECSEAAFCNGTSARCPAPPSKPDGTECNGRTQICQKGECSGSICLKWGMRECFLTSDHTTDKRTLCELACLPNTPNATCTGTSELKHITGLPAGVPLRPGSPCDDFQGHCDEFPKCRAVNPEGPLPRPEIPRFSKKTPRTILQWIKDYWWVLLIGVGFIVMSKLIKCCVVDTLSCNSSDDEGSDSYEMQNLV